jgi:hypothetical protein
MKLHDDKHTHPYIICPLFLIRLVCGPGLFRTLDSGDVQ